MSAVLQKPWSCCSLFSLFRSFLVTVRSKQRGLVHIPNNPNNPNINVKLLLPKCYFSWEADLPSSFLSSSSVPECQHALNCLELSLSNIQILGDAYESSEPNAISRVNIVVLPHTSKKDMSFVTSPPTGTRYCMTNIALPNAEGKHEKRPTALGKTFLCLSISQVSDQEPGHLKHLKKINMSLM